ncbi:hypothetical protein E2C01_084106 [Portunus trituberculatus]|uniref:Uncharacterized protein n=1 Tax=Portunus trituberculatus TaxID=210409 RepID=A0A5B7IUE9_PORTR|nr:hypothetical protein [Portunus trituberculatus]
MRLTAKRRGPSGGLAYGMPRNLMPREPSCSR